MGLAYTAMYAGIGAAIGAGIGGTIDVASGSGSDENTRKGAMWGAVAGGSLGLLRSFREFVYLPRMRNARAEAAAAGGETFPVIAYNKYQKMGVFSSGRVGAEMIAEAQGIPKRLWNDHLVSFQKLAKAKKQAPATFNGRIIAVGHGLGQEVEVGLQWEQEVGGKNFLRIFDCRPGIWGDIKLKSDWQFSQNINRIDLCVCYPGKGFTRDLKTSIADRNLQIAGWGSSKTTTPLGAGELMGVVREPGPWYDEALNWLYGTPAGTPMPAPQGNPAGGWGLY